MDIKLEDKCNLCSVKFKDHSGSFTTAFRKGDILIVVFELAGNPSDWNKTAKEVQSSGFVEVPICSGCLRLNF